MPLVIAIDFDDVLHDPQNRLPGKRLGEPISGAVDAMRHMKREGHALIIHSVWGDKPEVIREWLQFFGIPFDQITRWKPNADIYLDNRAVRFTSWNAFLQSGALAQPSIVPPATPVSPVDSRKAFKPLY